jgi:ZIP family zinc transporter
MMTAAMLGLIPESLKYGEIVEVSIGLFLGVLILTTLEKAIPHIDLELSKSGIKFDEKAMLIISANTLHNIPEGLSVGVSYASNISDTGNLIPFAFGLQNAPEGFLVAFLINQSIGTGKAFLIATATGGVEIVASILGFT